MSSKAKTYWAIGIVVGVLVVALLIWHSFFYGQTNAKATAATVGDQEFTTTELAYYYHSVYNSYVQMQTYYSYFGISSDYDTDLDPSEQYYDEDEGITYADYFLEQALYELQEVTILCSEAEAAGYTLSDEGQQTVEDNMESVRLYSIQSGCNSMNYYLKLVYGTNMTKAIFKELITNAILADEYAQYKSDSFTYSEDELEAYYQENKDDLDVYEYRYCYIYIELEENLDEDGEVIDATDEEIEEAMAIALEQANSMIADVESGTAFNTAAIDYVDEDSAESYADEEYNHVTDTMGSSLSSTYSSWLMDEEREVGDLTAIEISESGYCVVQFLGRDKGDNIYQTMSYYSIEILAETTANEEDGTDEPTDAQLAAALEEAEALLATWSSGDATEETFAALSGAVYSEDIDRSSLDDWFLSTDRQLGDVTTLEITDSDGCVLGYELIFLASFGQSRWAYQAVSSLSSSDYDAWYEEAEENYPAVLTAYAQVVPNL